MDSLTLKGIVMMVALPVLVGFGFSDACSNEIMLVLPMIPGAITAWYGRVRVGDINIFGQRK